LVLKNNELIVAQFEMSHGLELLSSAQILLYRQDLISPKASASQIVKMVVSAKMENVDVVKYSMVTIVNTRVDPQELSP